MRNTKKLKYSINSSVVIIGAIIVTLLVNALLVAFDNKISLEVDLTKNELYKLTDETKEVIKQIDEETKIVVLYNGQQSEIMNILTTIINKYSEENENIVGEVVDYYSNPMALTEYVNAIKSLSYPDYSMIFVQGDKYDTAEVSSYVTSSGYSNIENIITNKLATFVDGFQISEILMTEGHGEKGNAGFEAVLSMYNYQMRSINLLTEDLPENDKSLVIINAPTADFSADEIEKLDKFLDQGGNVQVYFDPMVSNEELPRLESYLSENWAIVRNHGVIVDNDRKIEVSENVAELCGIVSIAELAESSIVTPVKTSKKNIVYSAANALDVAADKQTNVEIETVLSTTSDAVLRDISAINEPVVGGVKQSKYNIMLTSTRQNYTLDERIYTGRVAVCGSSYMMDTLIGDSRYANEDLLINAINWMRGSEAGITVRAKEIPEGGLSITSAQFWTWFVGLVVVIPVLLLGIGIFVFVKRRYK